MGGDILFNLEDMNITEESSDIMNQEDQIDDQQQQNTEDGESQQASGEDGQQQTASEQQTEENQNTAGQEGEDVDEKASQEDAPSSDDSSQNSTLYALAQYLKEEGVLFIEEDLKDVNNLEDLRELIKNSNEKAAYANLNETQRRYQDALKSGIPKSEFEKIEQEIQTYTNIKEEDVESNPQLRYEILAIDMINDGVDKEKAMRLAKLSLNDENNVQDAKAALKSIQDAKRSQFQKLVEESKQSKELKIEDVKKSVFEKEKLFDQKLNDVTKNQLFDLITNEVDRDEEGKPLNELQKWQKDNPLESSVMLNYLFLMTNKGKDLSMIRKSGESKATKELEQRLRSTLSFDENGSLIIPDSMLGSKSGGSNKKQQQKINDNLSINI